MTCFLSHESGSRASSFVIPVFEATQKAASGSWMIGIFSQVSKRFPVSWYEVLRFLKRAASPRLFSTWSSTEAGFCVQESYCKKILCVMNKEDYFFIMKSRLLVFIAAVFWLCSSLEAEVASAQRYTKIGALRELALSESEIGSPVDVTGVLTYSNPENELL
jgi:hypothetical protein